MCLAIPGRIESTSQRHGLRLGKVRFGGVAREVVLEHVPKAQVGDYVLVHVGIALQVVDADEAQRTFALLEQLGQLGDELGPGSAEEGA